MIKKMDTNSRRTFVKELAIGCLGLKAGALSGAPTENGHGTKSSGHK